MSLVAGQSLGPFEILAPIGEGGMGDVYKARDTRLDRIVAIKVSKDEFNERFEREARAVAALNHPHICQLYDVGPNYLVMEYIEGKPVDGPLAPGKAVELATQILDAMDAAHRKRIIHRDLKPANILVTKEGVKLLDFGLARQQPLMDDPDATVKALTVSGTIAGTLQYMSPEQLQGKEADARSDIFSFGCVLYELLSGKRAFDGSSVASVIGAVLHQEPQPLVAGTPLLRVIQRCLAKDPEARFQSASDLKAALLWSLQPSATVEQSRTSRLGWVAAAVLALSTAGLSFLYWGQRGELPGPLRLQLLMPEPTTTDGDAFAKVSPNGKMAAIGGSSLRILTLKSSAIKVVPSSEGATGPFWSPDSSSVAFFQGGKLKRVTVDGGPIATICDAEGPGVRGASWSAYGVIVFSPDVGRNGIFRVTAAGGKAESITRLNAEFDENSHRYPSFLPDGKHFLFTARSPDREKTRVLVGNVDSNAIKPVLRAYSNAVYSHPGYLLYVQDNTLLAAPFDAGNAKITGATVPVAENIGFSSLNANGRFDVSANGLLFYRPIVATGGEHLTWFDRTGRSLGTVGGIGQLSAVPRISPADDAVAFTRLDPKSGNFDVWIHDLIRGTEVRLINHANGSRTAAWSPDGANIAYVSIRPPLGYLFQKAASGASEETLLLDGVGQSSPRVDDWSRDGRYVLMGTRAGKTRSDVLLVDVRQHKALPLLQTVANESDARIHPGGDLVAFVSDETGQREIFVTTFPKPAQRWRISTNGGSRPVWSHDGKELYFLRGPTLMTASTKTFPKFEAGVAKALFDVQMESDGSSGFAVSKDGRFLVPVAVNHTAMTPTQVVVNWPALLKR